MEAKVSALDSNSAGLNRREKMETKHTPMPWSYAKGISGYSIIADGETIAHTVGNGSPRNMERQRSGENESTARLIAAAPELLEALQLCLRACEADAHNVVLAMQKGRAVIAKATGAAK